MANNEAAASPKTQATILVVDDEPFVCELLSGFLTTLGHTVHEAASGEQGLRMATERRYDVVFTDIKMPGISGVEVLEATARSSRPSSA